MKTTLHIKNFRVFDESGVIFEFSPITILTGSNSSGKSSVVKAVLLLNSFLSQIKKAVDNGEPIELNKYKLDFSEYPINLMGRFDQVIHVGSKSVTFEYSVHSLMLSQEVSVQLVFSSDEKDELNNGYLDSVLMKTSNGVFFSSSKEKTYYNLNTLKKDFISFLVTEFAVYSFIDLEATYALEGGMTEDEYKKSVNELIDYLRPIDKKKRSDIFRYVRFSERMKPICSDKEECGVLEDAKNKLSLFIIPLLDKLADVEKEDFKEYINCTLLKGAHKAIVLASQRVIDAFIESSFDYFPLFFMQFEEQYLENVTATDGPLRAIKKGVRIPKPYELSLNQNYIIFAPFGTQIEGIWGNDKDLIIKDDDIILSKKQKEIDAWENRLFTFDFLYEVVMEWNRRYEKNLNECDMMPIAQVRSKAYVYVEPSASNPFGDVYHKAYKLLTQFSEALVNEALTPEWAENTSYVSSTRVDVTRLYTLENSNDFAKLLKNYFEKKRLYLEAKTDSLPKRTYRVDSFMQRWLEKFEVGKFLSFHVDKEGLGVQIRLHKSRKDAGRLLADEGYGITQLVSILLKIETAILSAKGERVNRFFRMDLLDRYEEQKFHYEVNTIAVEEPEIHLHPKYQSLLADMFCEAYEKYNIQFIIETHSEYLIRKAQVLVAQRKYKSEKDLNRKTPIKIYYVPKGEKPYEMKFRTDGKFSNEFGTGFFDEASNRLYDIL